MEGLGNFFTDDYINKEMGCISGEREKEYKNFPGAGVYKFWIISTRKIVSMPLVRKIENI